MRSPEREKMKDPWKPNIPHFGPRSKISSRLKLAHGSYARKTRKHVRFVSPLLNKFEKEIKVQQYMMRATGAANQALVPQQVERNVLKTGNSLQPKNITSASVATYDGKADPSASVSKHMDKDPTSRINSYSSPICNSNGTLRPLELSLKANKKQGLVQSSNCIRRPSSQAIPGLVLDTKNLPTHDKGATKGMHSENVPNGCIGGMKDKNTRCEPLRGCRMRGDTNPNMPSKRRNYIETGDDVMDHQSDENDSSKLLSSFHGTLKDYNGEVSAPYVSKCVVHQYDCCSKPIDESAWSGILKVGSEQWLSLAGHLSTKSCEKVWTLSKSLRTEVKATKVCRSKIWPKRWEVSRPCSADIGLYFLPIKMRPNKHYDQLVKDLIENDLALRVTIEKAEMLIFSSTLLPEQYQMFQSKHYLWGVFRPALIERKFGDELRRVDNTAEAATNATTSVPIGTTLSATNAGAVPTEASKLATKAHAEPTNQCRINSSMGALPGRVVSFVVRQTPRVEQLIQEMKREGALVVAMQGEMLTGDGSSSKRQDEHHGASRRSA